MEMQRDILVGIQSGVEVEVVMRTDLDPGYGLVSMCVSGGSDGNGGKSHGDDDGEDDCPLAYYDGRSGHGLRIRAWNGLEVNDTDDTERC